LQLLRNATVRLAVERSVFPSQPQFTLTLLFTPLNPTSLQAVVCVSAFLVGLPLALSLFRQHASVSVDKLEPQFQDLTDSAGNAITHLQYNKGL
jgi:hypothetical protein